MKKILVIAAHPDDEVLGMGGTISKLASEGNTIRLLIVTDGCSSQYRNSNGMEEILKRKYEETEKSSRILGIEKIYYGGLSDMKLDSHLHIDINEVIEKTIEEFKPQIVYTHFFGDVNLDHRCVYESTMVATRPVYNQCVEEVYCYSVPSSTEWAPYITNYAFLPNVFVNISDYENIKLKAINCYKTELRDYPHPRSLKYIEESDKACGLKCGLNMAEEFVCLRKIIK